MALQVFVPVSMLARSAQTGSNLVRGALVCALASIAVTASATTELHAETLRQAMAQTYRTNPRLDAERARLRATDEGVPQARAGWGPTITGSSDYGQSRSKSTPRTTTSGNTNAWGYSLNVVQPIFNGFQTVNSTRRAEADVRAGRETLRAVEQQVLLQAVTAYADVLRDQAVLRLRRQNVSRLNEDLRAARARRQVREITRTDVAQARARHARGASELDVARANLNAARAVYAQVVGAPAALLKRPSYQSRLLPGSLREALSIAAQSHPNVVSAKYREQAARHSVDAVRGELLPDVRLEASYGKRFDESPSVSEREDARITGRITVPFYRGGQVHSRVRQAKHRHVSTLQEIEQARQEVEATVIAAWSRLRAARSRLSSDHVQLGASKTALTGVREEERVGQRTILDVLDARQELISAQVGLARTRRDLVVAAYTMIAAVGRLNAEGLALMSEVYDPDEHYHEVRNKRLGISITQTAPDAAPVEASYRGGSVDGTDDLATNLAEDLGTPEDEAVETPAVSSRRPLRRRTNTSIISRSAGRQAGKAAAQSTRLETHALPVAKLKSATRKRKSKSRSGRDAFKDTKAQISAPIGLRGATDSRLADGSGAPTTGYTAGLILRDGQRRHVTIRGGRIN